MKQQATEHCTQVLQQVLSPMSSPDGKQCTPFQALQELVSAVIDKETEERREYIDLVKDS